MMFEEQAQALAARIREKQAEGRQVLLMLVGIRASGKTSLATALLHIFGYDALRLSRGKIRRKYGLSGEDTQAETDRLLRKEAIAALHEGRLVILDGTNSNRKRRKALLADICEQVDCCCLCVPLMTPLPACLSFAAGNKRTPTTPEEVRGIYLAWQPPMEEEGFAEVIPVYNAYEGGSSVEGFLAAADVFDQENYHHQHTLGEHCRLTASYVKEHSSDPVLYLAALVHDCGKITTKSRLNSRGEEDGNCHYYNHANAGAYEAMFLLADLPVRDRLRAANFILFHMLHYDPKAERAMRRFAAEFGAEEERKLRILNEGDALAH